MSSLSSVQDFIWHTATGDCFSILVMHHEKGICSSFTLAFLFRSTKGRTLIDVGFQAVRVQAAIKNETLGDSVDTAKEIIPGT